MRTRRPSWRIETGGTNSSVTPCGVLRLDVGDGIGRGAVTDAGDRPRRHAAVRSQRRSRSIAKYRPETDATAPTPVRLEIVDERAHEPGRARRRLVATVEKRMEPHRIQTAAPRQLGDGDGVILMAVHPARRDQPEAVQRRAAIACAVDRGAQRRVLEEAAVGDGAVDARQRLVDEASGADGEMTDLGVALLPRRQPDRLTARVDLGVRPACLERVDLRRARRGDGVAVRVRVASPPVEDDEHERSHRAHVAELARRHERAAAVSAAATMAANSSARRLAPPTSAPSMSCSREERRGVRRGDAAAVEDSRRAVRRTAARQVAP